MSSGGRRRSALALPLLAIGAVGVALAIVEVAVRIVLPPPGFHDAPLEFDRELGFRGVPGYHQPGIDDAGPFEFRLDEEGFRAPPEREAPPDEAPRIAFFGDSFLVGRGLRAEALLPYVFADRLTEGGSPVAVRNFSVIDFGTAQQLLLLRRALARERIDGAVLVVYSGNDLANNEPTLAGLTDVSAGDLIRPYLSSPDWENPTYVHPLRARLRRFSRLAATLERGSLSLSRQPRYDWLRPFPPRAGQSARLARGDAPTEALEVLRDHDPGSPWERAWERSFGLIDRFRREVEAQGGRFLVVVVPMEEQVVRTARGVALEFASRSLAGRPLDRVLDWDLPERRFAAFFRERGIDALLVRDDLRALAAEGTTPYLRDRHLNAAAHAEVASKVAAWWAGEAPTPSPPVASPVWWVPRPREGASSLDFREETHTRYLGDGWLDWASEDGRGGWRIGPRSLAVVVDRGGDVVVSGYAGDDADFPLAFTVELAGVGAQAIRVDEPGPFEVRYTPPASTLRQRGEYSVLLVGQRGRLDADVRVQRLGIESR